MLRKLFIFFALMACAPACNNYQEAAKEVVEPFDKVALRGHFEKIVDVAKTKDSEALLKALEPYFLTESDMTAIFGDAAPAVYKGYSEEILPKFRDEGIKVIIEQVEKGLTQIITEQVGPAYLANTTPGDQRMLDAMVNKTKMYTVRFHKPDDKLGLRLNGFIYLNDSWKMLLKSYNFLPNIEEANANADANNADANNADANNADANNADANNADANNADANNADANNADANNADANNADAK